MDWAGNVAINLHREGSIELIHLALDYYDHTLDKDEFETSILPLATAVLEFVSTYYGRNISSGGKFNGYLNADHFASWFTQNIYV